MAEQTGTVHPYHPNSVPDVRTEMLRELGFQSIEETRAAIPEHLRMKRKMQLPEPLPSEHALKKHVQGILSKNKTCEDNLNFLGAGCWQHHVPAICDEINQRGEFLTAYVGDTYSDKGKMQAFFESASMIGELVGMDAVSCTTYDWAHAVGSSLRMAARITARSEFLVPRTLSPDKRLTVANFLKPELTIKAIGFDPATGLLDLAQLKSTISSSTGAVYLEVPSYLGFVETQAPEIARIAHDHGALCVVGVDPSSLGVLAAPSDYGADIVCGDLQPLGIHMNYGGGLAGFIASSDDAKYVMEYPTYMVGIVPTKVPGENGFGEVFWERTSFVARDKAKDWAGTTCGLWGITAAVYLALVGPQGMRELGEGIMERAAYAIKLISEIKGVKVPALQSPVFKEFVVNFDGSGKTVADVNRALLGYGIFGGKDLTKEFPELGNSALYCVTEVHSKADLERLADALRAVVA